MGTFFLHGGRTFWRPQEIQRPPSESGARRASFPAQEARGEPANPEEERIPELRVVHGNFSRFFWEIPQVAPFHDSFLGLYLSHIFANYRQRGLFVGLRNALLSNGLTSQSGGFECFRKDRFV